MVFVDAWGAVEAERFTCADRSPNTTPLPHARSALSVIVTSEAAKPNPRPVR